MDVARTSMIHAAAPHFLWPFAVEYAAHHLNLQPRVSVPKTSPTLRWTGKVGDASVFRVWGSRAFVRDLSADKLSPRAVPCDVTFDESVPYYRLFPYRTAPLPPSPLFLVRGPPPVDPLPPKGPAPSGVSQVDAVEPVEVAVDSGAGSGGAEPGNAGSGGAAPGDAESGGAEPGGAESGSAEPGSAEPGGEEPGGAGSACVASRSASSRRELLSPQELREWFARRWSRAPGAGGTPGAAGTGGAAAAAGVGPVGASRAAGAGVGPAGGTAGAAGGTGAVGPAGLGAAGASGAPGAGAAGGVSIGGSPDAGPSAGAGVGAVGAGGAAGAGAAAGGTGAVPADSGDPARPRPYFVPLLEQVLGLPPSSGPAPSLECPQPVQSQSLLQPVSPLPAPSLYTGPTGGLTERGEPASRPALPVRAARTSGRAPRQRPPAVPRTHQMALRPTTASQRVPLPSPPASSLPVLADPESDSLRAASPTVARLLSTAVTDPSFESAAALALVAELVDFAACCRLDYATRLVAESASVCPPSVGGECALSTDVLEMTLCPSTAPLRVPLPSPPESSLPLLADPASDTLRAASPTVARLLSTVVTDPSFESTAASALVAELVDFAARCRLDYAAGLVAESASVCPPSVGGECALSTDVLEVRQEEFQCFTAALPHLVSMLIAPEGDPDAPDIPTPRSYAEAIEGPYSSQWQSAMDAEMASWKSTGTYVDEVPPPGANIVSGMWIFRVKRPPGSPSIFKARYVARGFSQRQGVDYFQTFSPTPKMTTLRVLLHVAAQRDYELHSLDFSTAYLQGSLHEEIWLRRPPGFTGSFPLGTQWSLRRPVYGLRQAPREWHDSNCAAEPPSNNAAEPPSHQTPEPPSSRAARQPSRPSRPAAEPPEPPSSRAARAARATRAAELPCRLMAAPSVLTFDAEGRAVDFEVWVDHLQLFLQCDRADGLSLFDHTSGVSPAPPATADSTVRSQWATCDAAARLAVRRHLPTTERAHFSQYKSAQTLYDAVVARYSSPATAALSRLFLPYLFPDLTAFPTFADLITHLRTSDTRFRTALLAEFCAKNPPPMYLTLYYIVTRLPDSLRVVRDHFLSELLVVTLSPLSLRGVPLPLSCPLLLLLLRPTSVGSSRSVLRLPLAGAAALAGARGAGALVGVAGAVEVVVEALEGVGVVVGVVAEVEVSAAAVGAAAAAAVAEGAAAAVVAEAAEAVMELVAALHRGVAPVEVSASSSSAVVRPPPPSSSVSGTLGVSEVECGGLHSTQRCFGRLTDACRHQFPDATEIPRWGDLSRAGVAVFDLDYDAILAAMYALSTSDEGDCYLCVPPDPGIEAAALGAGETAALGASVSAAPGAGKSAPSGTASAQVFHTFTLDSGASRSFFRDRTTLTPLSRPVAVSLADPSGGPVLASFSTILPCPAAPSGTLSGLYLPSFSTNLVSGADLQDQGVDQFTPASQRVTHCTCARTGRHLAKFTRRPGSSLYTLSTESPSVPASGQVAASSQVFTAASGSGPESAPCSCRLLSHQTLLWHHRLGHPSLPRLRGMASRVLVSGLPRSLPPLPPGPAPTCVPCVEGRQRAAPHSSEFPPTETPLQTLHMDVWGPARVRGQGHKRYFLLVVDDYSRYTTVFPLRSKGDVTEVLIDWIRAACIQLRESFGSDFPVLRLHSDRGEEFSSARLGAFCRAQGIRQTFTLPASPQKNGISERFIGMVMDVARTSMIHAAAPHFLWPFAVQYAAHQLNLQPRVSVPETSPTLRWTGKVGDASAFQVWGSRAFVRDLSADKLSPRAIPCDITFDESVLFYRLFPYRTAPLPPPPLFLAPGPPPVDPLPPQGPAPSGVSQVDALEPVEVAVDSGAARGAEPGGAESGGVEPRGAELGGAESGGAEPGGAEPGGAESARVTSRSASSRRELLSLQELREWFARRWSRAAEAGGPPVTPGPGGSCTGDTGAIGTGGAAAAAGVGATGASGAAGAGATGGVGAGVGPAGGRGGAAGGTGAAGPAGVGAVGAGGAAGTGAATGGPGAVPVGTGDPVRPRPYFVPLLEQVLGLPPSPGPAPPLECPQLV
ncbi:unnamed protein product [Closterium sp. NIES-54]